MNADPKPAKAIFLEAVERHAPDQWSAFLDRACAGQPELRGQVEALLGAHREVGTAAHREVADDDGPDPAATIDQQPAYEQSGTVIGPYKLIEPIGEGGMGSVWMAQQTAPVKRLVAVKLIKAGMDSKQVVARFEAERQALALMDHPNIARVLDGGTTAAGRPYFVMDLVKGVSITKYCDQHHLTPRQRLELFLPVCQAVQHAHQKGIIHRDIKPSNVLVAQYDGRPVPKVIDFGVAKAAGQPLTDKTLVTGFGAIVGTLEYMSPEQAETNQLDIDTRSDIYSLGVLLYELLAGCPPFTRKELANASMLEMLRVIREQEPSKPSTKLSSSDALPTLSANRGTEPAKLTRLVRGELDWIVMKALEKDRTRRYETANGFAADVLRYLADEAVLACPPSTGYRLKKFVRRNKGQVLAVSLVLLALVAGVAGTTWGMVEARVARDDAVGQKRLAEQAAEEERQAKVREAQRADGERQAKVLAEDKRKEAERNLAFARKGNEILGSVFAGLNPTKIAESGRPLQDVLRENLVKAVKDLEGSAIGDPLEVAAMQTTLGASLEGLGEYDLAVEVLVKAVQTRRARLGSDHHDTLISMGRLAAGYHAAGKLDKALPLQEETLRLTKAKFGPDHLDTLACMGNLALGYQDAGQLDKAVRLFEETLKLTKAKLGPDHPHTLASMNNLAGGYQAAGKPDLALPLQEETLKLMKAKLGPDHPDTLTSMSNLAERYEAAGQPDKAVPLHEETFRLRKAKLGPDHPDTLTSMNNLAGGYHAAGKLDLALPLQEETLRLRKAKLGPDHPLTLASMGSLALGYQDAGQLDKAVPLFEETLRLQKGKLGPEHPDTLASMGKLAWGYQLAGKLDLALPLQEETLKLMKAKLGPDHPLTLASMGNLAGGYRAAGKPDLALPLQEETLKLMKAKLGPDHPNTLTSMGNLAEGYRAAEKLDLALPLQEETLRLRKAKLGPDHPLTLASMGSLAGGYQAAGKPDLALPLQEETLKLKKAKLGSEHPDTLATMGNLAEGYRAAGKPDLALPLQEETFRLRKAKLGPDHPDTLTSMNNLAACCWSLRRFEKSVLLFEELLPLKEKKFGRAHPDTLITVGNLGVNYKDAGRVAEAIPLLEEAYRASKNHATLRWVGLPLLDAYVTAGKPAEAAKLFDELLADARKVVPKNSPQLAGELAQLGLALLEMKRYAAAEPLLRECLAIREKKEPDAWTTFNTRSLLGGSLLGQKKYKDAEPLLLKGYEGMKAREKTIPQGNTRIPEALDRLIDLYTATDRPEEAKTWRAERAKYPSLAPPREKK